MVLGIPGYQQVDELQILWAGKRFHIELSVIVRAQIPWLEFLLRDVNRSDRTRQVTSMRPCRICLGELWMECAVKDAIRKLLETSNRPYNANNLIDELTSRFKKALINKALQVE